MNDLEQFERLDPMFRTLLHAMRREIAATGEVPTDTTALWFLIYWNQRTDIFGHPLNWPLLHLAPPA